MRNGHVLCHVLAAVGTHASKLHAVCAGLLDFRYLETLSRISTGFFFFFGKGECSLWACNDGAFANHPSLEHAFDVGFESGREALLDLILITQVITFCHGGLIEVREQRCEPLDIVVWLLQQLRDGDWVMKALWESQQHAGL